MRDRLRAMLAGVDGRRKWGAAFALGKGGQRSRAWQVAMLDSLGANDPDVRWAASKMVVLAAAASDWLARRLTEVAINGDNTARRMALYCLRDARRSDGAAERAALVGLTAEDPRVRLAAVGALSRMASDPRASSRWIIPTLRDPDRRVCRAAAAARRSLRIPAGDH